MKLMRTSATERDAGCRLLVARCRLLTHGRQPDTGNPHRVLLPLSGLTRSGDNLCPPLALHSRPAFTQLGNNGTAPSATHIIRSRGDLGSHAPFTEGSLTRQLVRFRHAHRADCALLVRGPASINGIDVSKNQKQLGTNLSCQNSGSQILVDDGVDSLEAQ